MTASDAGAGEPAGSRPGATTGGEAGAGDAAIEEIVRDQRARLIGALARWCGDVDLAEDAFAHAVARALPAWRVQVPADPTAWIATAARNRVRDVLGSAHHRRTRALTDLDAEPAHLAVRQDDTLALMLACAHPAIDPALHAPLILRIAMGVAVADIAAVVGLPAPTLAKRLVRAKQKIRASRIPIRVPDRILPERIDGVLDAIYAAYAIDWLRESDPAVADRVADEAVHASQLLLAAIPHHLETRGLAALLLYLHSRSDARVIDGVLVPTHEQPVTAWDANLIRRAELLLRRGLKIRPRPAPGKYELQAAIQSAHAARVLGGAVDWPAIVALYDALLAVAPSRGAVVARAVAISRAESPARGLAELGAAEALDARLADFQPWHAARADLLARAGHATAAADALRRAIDLVDEGPSRRALTARLAALPDEG